MQVIERGPFGTHQKTKEEALFVLGFIGKKHHLPNTQQVVDVIRKAMKNDGASEGVVKKKALKDILRHRDNMAKLNRCCCVKYFVRYTK